MAQKRKSQNVPEAIVHTRALLIKQSEELQKWMDEQRRALAVVQAEVERTEHAYSVVMSALELMADTPPRSQVESTESTQPKYVSEGMAQLHNCVCAILKTGGRWRTFAIRDKAKEMLKRDDIYYDSIQQILARLTRSHKVVRPERGYYMWAAATLQKSAAKAKAKSTKKTKRTKRAKKTERAMTPTQRSETTARLKAEIFQYLQSREPATAIVLAQEVVEAIKKKDTAYANVNYYQVWRLLNILVKEKKVYKYGSSQYCWAGHEAEEAKPTQTTKPSKKKKATSWSTAALAHLAEYEELSIAQLKGILDSEGYAVSFNAVSKYVRRQFKKGKLKQLKRGCYTMAD